MLTQGHISGSQVQPLTLVGEGVFKRQPIGASLLHRCFTLFLSPPHFAPFFPLLSILSENQWKPYPRVKVKRKTKPRSVRPCQPCPPTVCSLSFLGGNSNTGCPPAPWQGRGRPQLLGRARRPHPDTPTHTPCGHWLSTEDADSGQLDPCPGPRPDGGGESEKQRHSQATAARPLVHRPLRWPHQACVQP